MPSKFCLGQSPKKEGQPGREPFDKASVNVKNANTQILLSAGENQSRRERSMPESREMLPTLSSLFIDTSKNTASGHMFQMSIVKMPPRGNPKQKIVEKNCKQYLNNVTMSPKPNPPH